MTKAGRGVLPGEVRQVGHVVEDLDAAMASWLALGVGPWTVIEVTQPTTRGGVTAEVTTAIGFAFDGALQVELIEARGPGSSVWHEARDTGRFGPHHVAYWTDDFDAAVSRATDAGVVIVQEGDGNGLARFCYLADPAGGMLVEIMELTDLSRLFMDDIRAACDAWDGTAAPIRR